MHLWLQATLSKPVSANQGSSVSEDCWLYSIAYASSVWVGVCVSHSQLLFLNWQNTLSSPALSFSLYLCCLSWSPSVSLSQPLVLSVCLSVCLSGSHSVSHNILLAWPGSCFMSSALLASLAQQVQREEHYSTAGGRAGAGLTFSALHPYIKLGQCPLSGAS